MKSNYNTGLCPSSINVFYTVILKFCWCLQFVIVFNWRRCTQTFWTKTGCHAKNAGRAQRRAKKICRGPTVQKQTLKQTEDDANIQTQNKETQMKKSEKLFPNSALFKTWGEDLSEGDQREAQSLYEKYGYNVYLSDRLPLDRPLPDTRDPRYNFHFIWFQSFILSSVHTKKKNPDSLVHSVNFLLKYFKFLNKYSGISYNSF